MKTGFILIACLFFSNVFATVIIPHTCSSLGDIDYLSKTYECVNYPGNACICNGEITTNPSVYLGRCTNGHPQGYEVYYAGISTSSVSSTYISVWAAPYYWTNCKAYLNTNAFSADQITCTGC